MVISGIVIIFLPIASYILLKNINLDSREVTNDKNYKDENIKQWKRIEVLKDYRFYIVGANMLALQ